MATKELTQERLDKIIKEYLNEQGFINESTLHTRLTKLGYDIYTCEDSKMDYRQIKNINLSHLLKHKPYLTKHSRTIKRTTYVLK